MGLADFKARLRLFFARKLREWASSIDENGLTSPRQPVSVFKERGNEPVTEFGDHDDALGSEPSHQPSQRRSGGPPQHWIDLVRERAPELLSLTEGYSAEEEPLPEDRTYARQPGIDDGVEVPRHTAVNAPTDKPTDKEDVLRNPEPGSSPSRQDVDQRSERKMTRGKSLLPRQKPLTLKPVSEPNPLVQSRAHARDQRTERAKPPRLIGVLRKEEKTVASSTQSSGDAVRTEHHIVSRESTRQPTSQPPPRDQAPAIHRTARTGTTMLSVVETPDKSDVTRQSEIKRSEDKVVRKTQSGPRRYLQAILTVTRETLHRAVRSERQPSNATTPTSLPLNSSSKDLLSKSNVVAFTESSRTQPPIKHETPSSPVGQRSEKKAVTVVYRSLNAPVAATRRASAAAPRPSDSSASIERVKTESRQPSPIAFPRPVNRFIDASNARVQDSVVNMPALIDEEKMNRASSMHLTDLRPGKNQWPDLPSATSTETADELAAHQRDLNRMRRLKQEQRGSSWNE